MLRNRSVKFQCEDVYLRVEQVDTPFTRSCRRGQVLRMPIAHGEGNYFLPDPELDALEARGGVAFRYVGPEGNPNGAARDIAGVYNERGNVCGLMPHPERAAEALLGSDDGLLILRSLVESAAASIASTAEDRRPALVSD